MKRIRRDSFTKRIAAIMGNNEGASLVLVSIIAIIVLTAVVVLRLASSTFLASANRQLNQDQAYELAASLGSSIDVLIDEGKFSIADATVGDPIYERNYFSNLPKNSKVVAKISNITKDGQVVGKKLTVTANVGKAEYIYTKEYRL